MMKRMHVMSMLLVMILMISCGISYSGVSKKNGVTALSIPDMVADDRFEFRDMPWLSATLEDVMRVLMITREDIMNEEIEGNSHIYTIPVWMEDLNAPALAMLMFTEDDEGVLRFVSAYIGTFYDEEEQDAILNGFRNMMLAIVQKHEAAIKRIEDGLAEGEELPRRIQYMRTPLEQIERETSPQNELPESRQWNVLLSQDEVQHLFGERWPEGLERQKSSLYKYHFSYGMKNLSAQKHGYYTDFGDHDYLLRFDIALWVLTG